MLESSYIEKNKINFYYYYANKIIVITAAMYKKITIYLKKLTIMTLNRSNITAPSPELAVLCTRNNKNIYINK